MAKVSPFYSIKVVNIYHNNDDCPAGKRIKKINKKDGIRKDLCDICKKMR